MEGVSTPPPQAGEKMYRVEKREKNGKKQAKIGKIRLKIEKRGENRGKSSNLDKIGTNG